MEGEREEDGAHRGLDDTLGEGGVGARPHLLKEASITIECQLCKMNCQKVILNIKVVPFGEDKMIYPP